MQVDRNFFKTLSESKQNLIGKAFLAVKQEEITVNDFLVICSHYLSENEYANLFVTEGNNGNNKEYNANDNNGVENYNTQEAEEANYNNYSASYKSSSANYSAANYNTNNYNEEQNNGYMGNYNNYQEKHNDTPKRSKGDDNLKTENIDDIMQYTGVDLKEEADNIVKDIYTNYTESFSNVDFTNSQTTHEDLFNIKAFSKYINNCCANRRVKITEDGVSLILLVIYRKIMDLLEKMDIASKVRIELNLNLYDFNIKNEHSKQLWYLNELEKLKFDKLNMQYDKEKKKKQVQEREDLIIKKRQSNSVAMAAMGIKQKSWMNPVEKIDEITRFESIYSPFDDKIYAGKNRIITHKDFIYVLERDKRYNKSIFLLQQFYKTNNPN
ncbi:hypothetical protein NUSPORA_01390 [Nucleospora cyclopteri]